MFNFVSICHIRDTHLVCSLNCFGAFTVVNTLGVRKKIYDHRNRRTLLNCMHGLSHSRFYLSILAYLGFCFPNPQFTCIWTQTEGTLRYVFCTVKCVNNRYYPIEPFSDHCRKTNIKAITSTNHNGHEQRDEPITAPSNYL